MGCNSPRYEQDYQKLGTSAGFYDDYQDGNDPAGISTQDPELAKGLIQWSVDGDWRTICGC